LSITALMRDMSAARANVCFSEEMIMRQTRHSLLDVAIGNAGILAHLAIASLVAVALSVSGLSAWAQTSRSIKMVVPIGPGSGLDIMARLLADQITRNHGVTTVVENRVGAAQVIATEAVAAAPPDGNTVLFMASPFVINPYVRKVTYNPLTSFEPVCNLASQPQFILVNGASPYRSLGDLVNAARAAPGQLTLASFGPASPVHIAFEMLKRAANIDMTFVPYSGIPPALNALLGQHVTAAIAGYAESAEHIKAGTLRALVTGARTRVEWLPDVPTMAESGYKDSEIDLWFGTVVPANTPKTMVSQLSDWFIAAMQEPEIKAKLSTQAFQPLGVCGAEFGAFIRKQYEDFGRIIRETNIKAE
jgi:tripartite-type tricarboxylate transporter receptor subunit TctC